MVRYVALRKGWVAGVLCVLGCVSLAHAQAGKPDYLVQGWSDADRTMFYTTSQGSQMMPYDWFLALERPGSEALFGADALTRFGYLANPNPTNNPDGLPVGFVKDSDDSGDWVGMNCSACHTNQIKFAGRTLQIDGGPTDADMWALISELGAALAQTSASQTDPKFKRFADRVRAREGAQSPSSDATLYKNLKEFSDYFSKFVASSKTDVPWGRARLDAFGMIFNRATAIDLDDWSNAQSPNAPVSYPFLWDTHWHDKVQWNGSAPNKLAIERLGRNVGEVLGVFAHTEIKKTFLPPLFFKTSAKRLNQARLEQRLSKLRSPAWPQNLAPIDAKKAALGAKLYQDMCVSCHAITPRNKPLGPIDVTMTPLTTVGTDPLMATNAKNRQAKSGILEGVRMPLLLSVAPLPAEGPSLELTGKIVIGAILAPPDWDAIPAEMDAENASVLSSIKSGQSSARGAVSSRLESAKAKVDAGANSKLWADANRMLDKQKTNTNVLAYKARPLDGIWATAPYLHNGSVASLYQLLLLAKDRLSKFYVGTRDFDAVNVGFSIDNKDGAFEFDTSKPGNSNAGHDSYGTDKLSDEQRWQLVEYLKTL